MVDAKLSEKSRKLIGKISRGLPEVPEGGVLLAVSGGADSTALLRIMNYLHKRTGFRIAVANCNFNLRGEESDRDSRFVEELCAKLGVHIHRIDFDAETYARAGRISIEMACRELRHGWFASLMESEGYWRLATGHNSSDNIETLMLNLLRGSGTGGLKGMLKDDGRIIRPLIEISRKEITDFLEDIGQDYVTDSTNDESEYRRNFLRNEVMPLLRERWEGADTGIKRSLTILQREHRIVTEAINKELEKTGNLLRWERINGFADPETLLFHFIRPMGGTSEIASEIACSLPNPRKGAYWQLKEGRAVSGTKGLILEMETEGPEKEKDFCECLKVEKIDLTPANKNEIQERIRRAPATEVWLPERLEEYFWRTVKKGERIRLLGKRGSKLCSDVFKEAGVSRIKRPKFKVLVERKSDRIVWMPGIRRSGDCLVGKDAKRVWRIEIPD